MVRGSELAIRMLAREKGGASLCYSPMLRDNDVLAVYQQWKTNPDRENWKTVHIDSAGRTDNVDETAYLLLHDSCRGDTSNCVVQLCGSSPTSLGQATAAVLDLFANSNGGTMPAGIDLNLGCPQECASKEGFGAFLVERNPAAAFSCIASMRKAINAYQYNDACPTPTLSAKIRLMKHVDDTIMFIQKLQQAGIDYIAIHCRHRIDKHDGKPNLDAGRKIVQAIPSLPVILNGGIGDLECANRVMQETQCHAVMIATGYLRNHQNFNPSKTTKVTAFEVACEYIDYAEKYPPPSYLYMQKHLRWILRDVLQPTNDPSFNKSNYADARVKLWIFLVRPYLRTIEQFRLFLALYLKLNCDTGVDNIPQSINELIGDVTFKSVKVAGKSSILQ
jgi:tRNA-dihydrouridine synthase